MSTHNLCFIAKIRKIGTPLHTPVLLCKSGVQGGITVMDMISCCLGCTTVKSVKTHHRRSTTGLIFFFFAFSPVWRPLRYVHAIILPLKPFLSILNQPSSMGYYIDKVGNAVS